MLEPDSALRPTSEIASVFSVPLAQALHPEAATLNVLLAALLLERERDPRIANPQPSLSQQKGVFESEFNLFSWPDPCIQQLRTFCWTELGRTIQALNDYSAAEMSRLQIFSHTWFHVTRAGGFVLTHSHQMASWSGVYCVADGGAYPADQPDSGVLRFHNPHHYSNMFLDAGNMRLRPPFHHGMWNVRLRPGQLVLFPSWLPHEVLPFHGQSERITIAFNCWFGMGGGA